MQAVLNSPFVVSVQQFFGKLKFWGNTPAANDPVVEPTVEVNAVVEESNPDAKIKNLETQVSTLKEEVQQVKAKKPYWKIITVVLVVAVVIAAIVGYFMGYGVDLLIDQVKGVFSRV